MPLQTVTTIDGKSIDLTNPEKRKLVILFATWCSDSQRAMKALHESDILNQEDLQIVAIARENTVEEIENFRELMGSGELMGSEYIFILLWSTRSSDF